MKFNAQAAEEAAEFFVEFRSGDADAAVRRRFSEWLTRSPEHVGAYLETAVVWSQGLELDALRRHDAAALIALARAEDRVVRLDASGSGAPVQAATSRGRPSQAAAVALGIAASLLLAAVVDLAALAVNRGVYSTEVGEQRSIALDDGSTIQLNSRSRIRVRFTREQRSVELQHGQALFTVAKDKGRPFLVRSGATSIRAVGTEFDVNQRRNGTVITVIEGRVLVRSAAPADDAGPYLAAGEQLVVGPRSVSPRPVHANLAAATAWTQRQLVFESASLTDVAEEINRYNSRQLVIDDAGLGDFHISGVFSSTDAGSLLKFLRARPDISVTESGDVIHVSRR